MSLHPAPLVCFVTVFDPAYFNPISACPIELTSYAVPTRMGPIYCIILYQCFSDGVVAELG